MSDIREIFETNDMPELARISVVSRNDWRVGFQLAGEFDVAIADELAATLNGELDAGRHLLHLDFENVTFLDCTVLGVLASVDERCRREHASLILVGMPSFAVRLIALCQLDQVLLVSVSPRGAATTLDTGRGSATAPMTASPQLPRHVTGADVLVTLNEPTPSTVTVPARRVELPLPATSVTPDVDPDGDDKRAGLGVA